MPDVSGKDFGCESRQDGCNQGHADQRRSERRWLSGCVQQNASSLLEGQLPLSGGRILMPLAQVDAALMMANLDQRLFCMHQHVSCRIALIPPLK